MQVVGLAESKRSCPNSVYFDPPFERTAEGLALYRKSLLKSARVPIEENTEIAALLLKRYSWLALARAASVAARVTQGNFTWEDVRKRAGRFKNKPHISLRGDF